MKVLNKQEMNSISGGANLVITQHVSTTDISQQCVAALTTLLPIDSKTDEQILMHLLSGCTFYELDIIDDRLDSAPFMSVELV